MKEAMAKGYIGEVVVMPRKIVNVYRTLRGRKTIGPATMFYYGEIDDYLRDKFQIVST